MTFSLLHLQVSTNCFVGKLTKQPKQLFVIM